MLYPFCKKIGALIFGHLFFLQILSISAAGEDHIAVGYGGVYTAGNEHNYPVYSRNKSRFNIMVKNTLERMSEEKRLPFNLLFETDIESRKQDIDNPYTLAVVVTRDDVAQEKFSAPSAVINKIMVNVGVVVVIYQTVEDISGKKRNTVVFSLPFVGYSMNLEGKRGLSDREIDDLFVKNASVVIEEHLSKRLQKTPLVKIEGAITDVRQGEAIINIGSTNGLDEEQRVSFFQDNEKVGIGKIKLLKKSEAIVKIENDKFIPRIGMKVVAFNVKGVSTGTYQIVEFKISSKKAALMFQEKTIGSQIAQWLSDFIVDKAGKVVLPTKVGGEWIDTATETSFMKLVKDGQEHIFEVPPPKYPVFVDLTGVSSKMADSNNVNEIWIYKAWLKINIPSKGYSKEYSDNAAKNVVQGIQSFQEKDELFDLIHRLSAKIAKEGDL